MPVDRDVVVVVEIDDVTEPEVSGDRCRLARNPFHQVAIADDGEYTTIEQGFIGALEAGA